MCGTWTAFGSPLVPEVKIIMKRVHRADLGVRDQRSTAARAQSGAVTSTTRTPARSSPSSSGSVLVVDQQQLAVGAPYVGQQRRPRAGWC